MAKILLAGHDLRLLETRAAVLKKTGAAVAYYAGPNVLEVVRSQAPDLVVLCHSLGRVEAENLAGNIHACCPRAKILLVVSQGSEEKSASDRWFDAKILPEPLRLIRRAAELLAAPSYDYEIAHPQVPVTR
ncbi:MAG TPA: hypothetical protein VHW70_15290 [Edaphobacter sp.]|jgi:CheY-like chemotaxis protein|nr:hypothetical protein [Edaphobacter sp.]